MSSRELLATKLPDGRVVLLVEMEDVRWLRKALLVAVKALRRQPDRAARFASYADALLDEYHER